jgi:hypothetical protein
MLIISPFLDESTVNLMNGKIKNKKWLFSRKEELDCLSEKAIKPFICKQFSQFLVSAEYLDGLSESNTLIPRSQNLHAKLFIGQNESRYQWLLGSANCSSPAYEARNIEFLVAFTGNNPVLKPSKIAGFLTEIKKDEITLFEPYDIETRTKQGEQKKLEISLRKIIYDLSIIPINGQALLIEGGTAYNLILDVDATSLSIPDTFSVRLKPLPEKDKIAKEIIPGIKTIIDCFTGYSETQLSPFILWEIWEEKVCHKQFLVKIDIELPDSRFKRIFTSIINSREKFLKYLTFLLHGEEPELIESTLPVKEDLNNPLIDENMGNWAFQGIPVFEKLMVAASRYPKKLDSIDRLIEYLKSETTATGEQIITDDFESLWGVFKKYRENSK